MGAARQPPESMTPSTPRKIQIRNQRYPRWFEVAGHVVVGGLFATLLLIGTVGVWLYGMRAYYVLLAVFVAVLPIALHGWLLIWDLSRPGPGRRVTARELFDAVARGVRGTGLAAAVEWTALALVRPLLPSVHTVSWLKLGDEIEVPPRFRFSPGAVKRVRFERDPGEDFKESEPQTPLYEAAVEIHSGRRFRLIVDEADVQRLKEWAVGNSIAVSDGAEYSPHSAHPVNQA
jgi:hypothetical protein